STLRHRGRSDGGKGGRGNREARALQDAAARQQPIVVASGVRLFTTGHLVTSRYCSAVHRDKKDVRGGRPPSTRRRTGRRLRGRARRAVRPTSADRRFARD